MAVVLRLMRAGAKKRPFYRVVAADSRRQRDGRFLEIVGHYDPLRTPYELVIEKDQVEKWLSRGAVPSEQVSSLLRNAGMMLSRPSAPKKKPAAAAATAAAAAKPKTAKKRAPRKVSARKTQKKAARKSGKKPAPKTAKKK
jgi:small subunit ribosomal protein S16